VAHPKSSICVYPGVLYKKSRKQFRLFAFWDAELIFFAHPTRAEKAFARFSKKIYIKRSVDYPKGLAVYGEVQDAYGNIIYLTDERWEHIIENHPELEEYREEVLSVVRSGRRKQDPLFPDTFYYSAKTQQINQWNMNIEVVVLFREKDQKPNNFVVSAYSI